MLYQQKKFKIFSNLTNIQISMPCPLFDATAVERMSIGHERDRHSRAGTSVESVLFGWTLTKIQNTNIIV